MLVGKIAINTKFTSALCLISFAAAGSFLLTCATNAQQPQKQTREIFERRSSVQGDNLTTEEIVSKSTNGADQIEVRAKNIELSVDEKEIKTIRAGGYLIVQAKQGSTDRYLKITPASGGGLEHSFVLQGKPHPFDPSAQSWLAGILLDFSRNSDAGAEARFRRILKERGVTGVLDEIPRISNESIKRAYFQKILEGSNANSMQRAGVIEQAGRELSSSYEKTDFLLWAINHGQVNDATRAAFFKVVDALDSDYERSAVLTALIKTLSGSEATMLFALKSAMKFSADYELADFLIQFVRKRPINDNLRTQFLTAVKKLQSSYDQDRVLAALSKDEKQR